MTSYWNLLQLVLPVFAVMGIGVALRRADWLNAAADASLLKLVVNLLYPALIFENVHANSALREAGNLAWAPLIGFVTIAGGIALCYYAARVLGLGGVGAGPAGGGQAAPASGLPTGAGKSVRSFGFTCGFTHYGCTRGPLTFTVGL